MAASAPQGQPDEVERRVVAAALELAAAQGWEQVRLAAVAERAGLVLPVVGRHFRDVDAIANAWFAAARLHLFAAPWPELEALPVDRRLAAVMERWLDHFGPDRPTAVAMIRAKLHPTHAHHWGPLVFDLSRLVHDFLDVARVPGRGLLRPAQEVALTGITLAMLGDWAADRSATLSTTRQRLRRRLGRAGRLAGRRCRIAR